MKTNRMALSEIFDFIKPAPAIEQTITDPLKLKEEYKYWRKRIMITTIIGYALFYFVRKNLSIAMPALEADLGISKTDLGLFLTLQGVIYGVSKFLNGFLGDRANPRYFMAIGLFMSGIMNFIFGLSSAVVTFGIVWMINGWFQGMGFPPCANAITNWFSPKERGVKFSLWNTSHSIGAALVLVLNGFLVVYDWRLCFYVPGAIAIFGAIYIVISMRDKPESLGLPPVEVYRGEALENPVGQKDDMDFKAFLRKRVFGNPMIWILCAATFFLYVIRYSILDWGPTFLTEMKGINLTKASWIVACFEGSGILGMLSSGWMMDHVFKGRGGRAALIYMVICTIAVFLFWRLPLENPVIYGILLCIIGFFIYGPQALVGVIVANIVTKRAAATAIGLTGFFAYLSTIISGWGIGMIVTHGGWDLAFKVFIGAGIAAAIFFAITWNVGYIPDEKKGS